MLLRHLLGYVPAHAANALVGFGGVFILTRLLEPSEYGRYALAISALALIHQTFFTWLEAAVARRYAMAEERGDVAQDLATAFAAAAAVTAALAALGGGALIIAHASGVTGDWGALLGFAFGVIVVSGVQRLSLEARRAAREVARVSALQTTQTLFGFLLGVALVLATDLQGAGPIGGLFVAALIVALVDLPSMLRRAKPGRPDLGRLKVMFGYGGAVSASLFFEETLAVADRFLITFILGEASTGVYAAGYGLANRPLDVLFVWAGMTATPLTIAALEGGGGVKAREMARKFAEVLILICLPAAAGLALVAAPFATVMLEESYRADAIRVIPPIAFAGFLNGVMTYYIHQSFLLANRSGQMALSMAAPAVLNVGLNLWWIPLYGIMGAVWATVAAYAVGITLCAVWGRRLFPLPLPWLTLGKALVACGLMALGVRLMPSLPDLAVVELLLKAGTGATVYGLAALALDIGGCRAWLTELRGQLRSAEAS